MTRRIVLVDIGEGLSLSGVLPSVALHAAYSAKLVARGGVAPYTFTTASTLPEGLTLDRATGVFSAPDVATPGTFAIVVTVMDLSGATAVRTFSLQVVPQPLSLSGDAPDSTYALHYSYTYQATGGVPPYVWRIAGSLPEGINLDDVTGELSGVPMTTGDFAWSISCSDSNGAEATITDGMNVTWYPSALFVSDTVGGWWDPSDLSTLFQDAAGTIPVTTAGQAVSKMLDKSGNGLHWSCAATLAIDVDGTPYLAFDGSTSHASFGAIGGGLLRHLTMANSLHSTSGTQIFLESSTNYNNAPYGQLLISIEDGSSKASQRVNGSTNQSIAYTQKQFGSSTFKTVSSYEFDRTQTTVSQQIRGWANGSEISGAMTYPADGHGLEFPSSTHYVAARAGNSFFTGMDWYGGVYLNRVLTAAEFNLLVDFMRQRIGT